MSRTVTTLPTIINLPHYETLFLRTLQEDPTQGIIFLIKNSEGEQTPRLPPQNRTRANIQEDVCPAFGMGTVGSRGSLSW